MKKKENAGTEKIKDNELGVIRNINYEEEMQKSYLDYSMNVITNRALPDIRDGLKPVQRRILFAMEGLKNYPDKPFKKSARIVGDTMGKYHPHGDCLRADTKFLLTDGTVKTIEQLYKEGKDAYVVSVTEEGELAKGRAHSFRIGTYTNVIYRIHLKNGFYIDMTDNHPVMKHNLKFGKADRLKIYDLLFHTKKVNGVIAINKEHTFIKDIEVINIEKEVMYDFSVDNYRNALISANEENTEFICVHNSSIYEAMARMTQDFIIPVPLVEGHGNFGSIDGDKPAAARYCVVGDTLLPTTEGVRFIKDLARGLKDNSEKEIDITIQSIEGTNTASKIFNSGKANIIEVITDYGYSLKGSFNHPVIVSETGSMEDIRWVLLSDIKVGDKVLIRADNIQNTVDKVVLTKGDIADMLDNLDNKLSKPKRKDMKLLLRARNMEQNYFLVGVFNKYAFITDEAITIRGEKEMLFILQQLLLNKGILSNLAEGEGSRWLLRLFGEDNLKIFAKKIGFLMSPHKRKRLAVDWKSINKDTLPKQNHFLPVKEINRLGEETIYSIRVDSECHSFVTNGFVSHNTEVRLTPISLKMLEGLSNDVVDMKKNFDETLEEPTVLPVKFPNLLINGTSGIAVGMASSIPPHNFNEVIRGSIEYLKNPNITLSGLMKYIKGPDFPTGGIITNKKDLNSIYKKGLGQIRLRSRLEVEPTSNGRCNFVITEVPYNFAGNKERLINDLITSAEKGVLSEVIDIRDESSAEGIRIVLETKKGTDRDKFINKLFSKTQAQANYRYDFKTIEDNKPVVKNLLSYMDSFINFQREIYIRNFKYRLNKLKDRKEVVEGLVMAHDKLDVVIEVLRTSKSIEEGRKVLMTGKLGKLKLKSKTMEKIANSFSFTKLQTEAILQMKLQRLVAMEREALVKELEDLNKEVELITKILSSKTRLDKEIIKGLEELNKKYNFPRKTKITQEELKEVVEEEKVEEVYVLYDKHGYIKTIDENSFKRADESSLEEYSIKEKVLTSDKIYFFTENANLHQLEVKDLPRLKIADKGENIYNLFDIKKDKVIRVMKEPEDENEELLFITEKGYIKKVLAKEFVTRNKTTLSTKLKEEDRLIYVSSLKDKDFVVVVSNEGYILKFKLEDVGTSGKMTLGNISIKFKDDDSILLAATSFSSKDKISLSYTENGEKLVKSISTMDTKKRNQRGVNLTRQNFEVQGFFYY